jgi:hypothetical protein
MLPAAEYIEAFRWQKAGRLHYLYPEDLPAKVGDALDLLDSTMADAVKTHE